MANEIFIPYINPIRLYVKNLQYDYNFKHLDVALNENQILDFQTNVKYYNKVQKKDNISFQIITNYGPITVRIIDCNNNVIANGITSTIPNIYYKSPYIAYKCDIDTTTVAEGVYYVEVIVGMSAPYTTLISEPIYIASYIKNTVLFEYSNSINYGGAIFQNGEIFKFRTEAILTDFQPQRDDEVFTDQNNDIVMLSSFPYRTFKLIIGNAKGTANWVVDILNHILGLEKVLIDGKQFTVNDGAKFEPNRDRLYPLSGWTIELREAFARNGVTVSNDIPLQNDVIVTYVIEPKVFGNPSPVFIQQAQ
mgnify:CR=1 FL=1